MLTAEEARQLAASPLVDVGAHTLSHPRLSHLPREAQRVEIQGSKARLEEVIERPVTSFAYAFGQAADFTRETVALVREAGFLFAGAVRDIAVSRSSPLYELPDGVRPGRVRERDLFGRSRGQRVLIRAVRPEVEH